MLVNVNTEQKSKYQRSTINTLKQVNQSLRPMQIKEGLDVFIIVQNYFNDLKNVINKLILSEQATEYTRDQ